MQVVPSEIKKCVAFISYKNKQNKFKLAGTGFFIAFPMGDINAVYLVTARHVIGNIAIKSIDDQVYIRINTLKGATTTAISPISQWRYHDDSTVDAAVIAWAPDQKLFDWLPLHISMAATSEVIAQNNIGEGDEVFMAGLFSNHAGQNKNLPIIRTGSIALISDEKIETNSPFGAIDAYLIEARSIGGLSGSPVFVHLGSMRTYGSNNISLGSGPRLLWLGLMHGHWDIDESEAVMEIDSATDIGRKVNMGIGIVVPAVKILEILTQPSFIEERKKWSKSKNNRKS